MLDPLHPDLVKPLVAEVEQITEDTIRLQTEGVQCGGTGVAITLFVFIRVGDAVIGPLGVIRPFAELELIKMLIVPVERREYGVMQLFERLVASDFDIAEKHLVGELVG